MPYVKQELREYIDEEINNLVHVMLARTAPTERKGLANYVITRILLSFLQPASGWNYASLADVIATLECSKQEIYRRLVAPYEDKAVAKNSDLLAFSG
jgi:hypothetical protein